MNSSEQPLVFIVILNYQRPKYTLNCLDSLTYLQYSNYSTVVVDNGSGDDSISWIQGSGFDCHLISSEENLGFSGGCNLGIAYALEQGADYVWLLNNDTLVKPDTLCHLVEKAQKTSGMVGSVLYYIDDPRYLTTLDINARQFALEKARYQTAGIVYNPWTGRHRPIRDYELSANIPVDSLTGASLLLPTHMIRKIGKFDEDYFLYFEDAEYNYRARQHGFPTHVVIESQVFHYLGGTSGRRKNPTMYYYIFRNRLKFGCLVGTPLQRISLMTLTFYALVVRLLKSVFNNPKRARFHQKRLWVEIGGLLDFLGNVSGPCPYEFPEEEVVETEHRRLCSKFDNNHLKAKLALLGRQSMAFLAENPK